MDVDVDNFFKCQKLHYTNIQIKYLKYIHYSVFNLFRSKHFSYFYLKHCEKLLRIEAKMETSKVIFIQAMIFFTVNLAMLIVSAILSGNLK